jgi:peptidoglycan/LPS O-acetylase OafA/YrhL
VFLLAVLAMALSGAAAIGRRDWVAVLTYTVNFVRRPAGEVGHIWSLSIEEHFYLLWPAVVLAGALASRRAALATFVACFLGRWVVLLAFPRYTPMSEVWTFTRLGSIAMGCLLSLAVWEDDWRARLDRFVLRPFVPAMLVIGLAVSLGLGLRSAKWSVGIGFSLNATLIALIVWSAVRRPARWLNHPAVAAVGVGSYSLYLWQQLFLNPYNRAWLCRWPQNLLFACLAAVTSYWVVERPFLKLKDRHKVAP